MLLKAWLFFFIHVVRYLPLLIHVKKNTIKNNILIGLDTAADMNFCVAIVLTFLLFPCFEIHMRGSYVLFCFEKFLKDSLLARHAILALCF